MPLSDYRHWNEDAERVWWEEEGRHADEGPPYCDECGFNHVGECQWDDDDYEAEQADARYKREREERLLPEHEPDYFLDEYMEDRLSGGGIDVDPSYDY